MKNMKKLICISISIIMILSASATSIFGQTEENISPKGDEAKILRQAGGSFDTNVTADSPNVRINRKKAIIGRSQKLRLKAYCYPGNGKEKHFRWASSDWRVAQVTPNGTVWGVKPGRAKIMVSLRSDPLARAVCTITVGYNIKYHTNGGNLSRRAPRAYYNEKVKLKEPIRKGYKFKGWYRDKDLKNKITEIDKDAKRDYNLYAKWAKK